MPRQARADIRATASSRDTVPLRGSHQRALVSASPVRPGGEQQGPLGVGAGVGRDDLGDRLDAHLGAAVDDGPHVGVVAQVGLEDQAEGLALGVDEVEVGPDGAVDPGPVVVGAAHRLARPGRPVRRRAPRAGQVQLPLAREVLVEDRLADAGPVGDVVHRGGVEALGDEDVLGCASNCSRRAPRGGGTCAGGLGGGTWRLHGPADVTGEFRTGPSEPERDPPRETVPKTDQAVAVTALSVRL